MLTVSQETKSRFWNSGKKKLTVSFPELGRTLTDAEIIDESFSLLEVIESGSYLTFTGCYSSQMGITLTGISDSFKGEQISVSIRTDDLEPIPLFKGVVDQQNIKDYDRGRCELVAFDDLYTKGQIDIADWYNSLDFPVTLYEYRTSLFEYLDIQSVNTSLVNDTFEIFKQYAPVTMKALDSIKSICQINGVFGIINRNGIFEYRSLEPQIAGREYEPVRFYRNIDYKRYSVKPITKVIVRQSDSESGGQYGTEGNTYIVQGNMFTLNVEEEDLGLLAQKIYGKVSGLSYIPAEADHYGMPWVEVGDSVTYRIFDPEATRQQGHNVYVPMTFYVFERTLTGIAALEDNFASRGEELQSVFISSLNAKIDTLLKEVESTMGRLNDYYLDYVIFSNQNTVEIRDGETGLVAETDYAAKKGTQIMLHMEYLLKTETTEVETDGYYEENDLKITVSFYWDHAEIESRHPVETYRDGEHILTLTYNLIAQDELAHNWRVYMSCKGGGVVVPSFMALNTMSGQGLIGDVWDGAVKASDDFAETGFTMIVSSLNDSASVSFRMPMERTAGDSVSATMFSNVLESLTDSIQTAKLHRFDVPYSDDVVEKINVYSSGTTWLATGEGSGSVTTPDCPVSGIQRITSTHSGGVRYLISFDSARSWHRYSDGWEESSDGMTEETMQSITSSQYALMLSGRIMVRALLDGAETLTDIQIYSEV